MNNDCHKGWVCRRSRLLRGEGGAMSSGHRNEAEQALRDFICI